MIRHAVVELVVACVVVFFVMGVIQVGMTIVDENTTGSSPSSSNSA